MFCYLGKYLFACQTQSIIFLTAVASHTANGSLLLKFSIRIARSMPVEWRATDIISTQCCSVGFLEMAVTSAGPSIESGRNVVKSIVETSDKS